MVKRTHITTQRATKILEAQKFKTLRARIELGLAELERGNYIEVDDAGLKRLLFSMAKAHRRGVRGRK